MAQFLDDAARAHVPELVVRLGTPSPTELIEAVRDAAAVVHFQTRLTEQILAACPRLRAIVFLGTGVSSWVDLRAAERRAAFRAAVTRL